MDYGFLIWPPHLNFDNFLLFLNNLDKSIKYKFKNLEGFEDNNIDFIQITNFLDVHVILKSNHQIDIRNPDQFTIKAFHDGKPAVSAPKQNDHSSNIPFVTNFKNDLKNTLTMTKLRSKIERSPSEYLTSFHGQCNTFFVRRQPKSFFRLFLPTSNFSNAELINPSVE